MLNKSLLAGKHMLNGSGASIQSSDTRIRIERNNNDVRILKEYEKRCKNREIKRQTM